MALNKRPSAALYAMMLAAFALLALTTGAGNAVAAPALTWRVQNPFRFFTDPADTEVHRATYRSLGPDQRYSPVLSAEQALQRRHSDGWAATMFRKTCGGSANQFGCESYKDYFNPDGHTIIAQIKDLDEASNLTCRWLTAPLGGAETRGDVIEQPCAKAAEFRAPYPSGLKITVEIGGRPVLDTTARVRDLLIVGMGDSFASGEGNPDVPVRLSRDRTADYGLSDSNQRLLGYPARTGDWQQIGDRRFITENARWIDQACHRSLYSYQLRAALQLSLEDPHRAVTYVGMACSGAEITEGLFLRYKGNEWVPNPPMLSQISAAAEAQCGREKATPLDVPEAYHLNGRVPELKGGLVLRKCPKESARKIDLIFLSIGGNDIGFSRLLANAILSKESTLRMLGGWLGEVYGLSAAEAQISRLDSRYKVLNRALHNLLYVPWEESDRILLAGYPGMALSGDGSETCKDGRAGFEVVPDFVLSESKLKEGAWIGDKLHRIMRDSARDAGWTFVESHRRAFIDRGICSGTSTGSATSVADELRLPRKIDGVWTPYNPADFQPYADRQRWFRTPNDAFLTGNFHVAASLLTKVLKLDSFSWFQLLLASTYSGAFHPTAEGHAAIADAVVEKARVVLSKYGSGPSRDDDPADGEPAPLVDEPGITLPDIGQVLPSPGAAPSPAVPMP